MKASSETVRKVESFILRLFVAGDELHSRWAKENLRKFCKSHMDASVKIEVVDVLESFDAALENNIFFTPALIKVSPAPAVTIFGDVSNTKELIKALRLGGEKE